MGNTPIGLGPNTNIAAIGQHADANANDKLQFRVQDRGSATAELLRGKIGQLRLEQSGSTAQPHQPDFRTLLSPSALTQQVLERLQRHT